VSSETLKTNNLNLNFNYILVEKGLEYESLTLVNNNLIKHTELEACNIENKGGK
jgi:hypothetical protein